jgi:plastocyanin
VQTHTANRLYHSRRPAALLLLLLAAFLALAGCSQPPAASITVNADGTFSPSSVTIQAGEKIQWTTMSATDAIVQIADPALFPSSDPCGIADSDLDHAFAAHDANEFTGPSRQGVSGIFVLGQNGPGLVQRLASESCACESAPVPCTPTEVAALDGNTYKLCPGEGAVSQMLDATWDNPDVTGVILRLNWSDIQVDNNGTIEFFWDDIDREMDRAVASGKLFTLDVRAAKEGTPTWIFTDYAGPAGPGPVAPLTFKDWGSEPTPPPNSCGFDLTIGSPMDPAYRDLYIAMIEALADHVASDARWFQALAHVKVSGANFLSSEARLPNRCYDGDGDGVLDTMIRLNGRPDPCLCNSKIWADAGYTPAGLYAYYRSVENAIYNAFHQRKSLGYQLIQAGFPRVESPTNFEGDSLQDQRGIDLLSPPGVTSDDISGVTQTVNVLAEADDGRFVDPSGALTDRIAAKIFVPQHSGIGRLPEDDGRPACSQAVAVDAATQEALFPIAIGTNAGGGPGCPNRWAVEQGTIFEQITGFQTQNPAGVGSPADVESALWNLTINSNGVFLELYEQLVWQIGHTLGTGPTAAVLDPNRTTFVGNPAPYSKNLHTWTQELHARRQALVDRTNPHLRDPFPGFYQHTFTRQVAVPETYYYINPSKCALTTDPARVGQITVNP